MGANFLDFFHIPVGSRSDFRLWPFVAIKGSRGRGGADYPDGSESVRRRPSLTPLRYLLEREPLGFEV